MRGKAAVFRSEVAVEIPAAIRNTPSATSRRFWQWFERIRPASGATGEIAALDGVRALAILLVLWHHVFRWGPGDWPLLNLPILSTALDFGFSGVLLFFVLSGFLLFLPYARALLSAQPWPSAKQFYRRRALRILPVYYGVLIVAGLLLASEGRLHGWVLKGLALSFLLLQNVSGSASNLTGVLDGALWTLAIEWQFYLLLPWIALAIAKFARTGAQRTAVWRAVAATSVLIVFGLAVRVLGAVIFYSGSDAFRWLPVVTRDAAGFAMRLISGRYLEEFALGMLLSIMYVLIVEQGHLPAHRAKRLGRIGAGVALPGLVICALWAQQLGVFETGNDWGFIPTGGWSWVVLGVWGTTLCYALLVMGVLIGSSTLRRIFSFAPLRYIGIISYSMYVWHLPIINLVRHTGTALLAILLLASISYWVIERPFLKRRYRVRKRA